MESPVRGNSDGICRIIFICTPEGGEEDDWTDEDGLRHIVIHLPYFEVQKMPDARPLMLAKAKERLGLAA